MPQNASVQALTDDTFADAVERGEGLIVVDFWAPWCGPCHMIAPIIERLAESYAPRVRFAKVNVDVASQTAARFGIRSIPTIALFQDGKLVDTVVGAVPQQHLDNVIKRRLTASA